MENCHSSAEWSAWITDYSEIISALAEAILKNFSNNIAPYNLIAYSHQACEEGMDLVLEGGSAGLGGMIGGATLIQGIVTSDPLSAASGAYTLYQLSEETGDSLYGLFEIIGSQMGDDNDDLNNEDR